MGVAELGRLLVINIARGEWRRRDARDGRCCRPGALVFDFLFTAFVVGWDGGGVSTCVGWVGASRIWGGSGGDECLRIINQAGGIGIVAFGRAARK